jgi:hypothetical protein
MTSKIKSQLSIYIVIVGVVLGFVLFGMLRVVLHKEVETHYHSNFALYIDGKREEFKSFTYYEEIAACTTAFADNPKGRTHLHDDVNDVIHVHDKAVTYADFFNNINWTLGPSFVSTPDALLESNTENSWVYILNGKKMDRVDNLVIGDQDKLLLSYGNTATDYTGQYNKIQNKAKKVDAEADPATCSGANGPHDHSFSTRLKSAFNFRN